MQSPFCQARPPEPRNHVEELIAQIQAEACRADSAALRCLYACLRADISRWVARLNRHGLLGGSDVDDFLQDAYALLPVAVRRYDPARPAGGQFRTFLEQVIARRFHNRVRQRRHALEELRPLGVLDHAVAALSVWPTWLTQRANPEGQAEAAELVVRVRRLVRALPDSERYVWKAVVAGWPTAAVAAHLHCSERTARRLKHDTIEHVRALLDAPGN